EQGVVRAGVPNVKRKVLAFDPTGGVQRLAEHLDARLEVFLGARREDADPSDLGRRLRLDGERRGEEREGERDEKSSPLHSIISSARASTDRGILTPSAVAGLRVMTSSTFVGCSTGRSAGLLPFRIWSTYAAARRKFADSFGP